MNEPPALADLNDHIARLFAHADALLDEWKRYGDQLRREIDAQARGLETRVAHEVDAQLARSVGQGLASLRQELNELTRSAHIAARAKPSGRARPPLLVVGVASANALLVLLLVLSLVRGGADRAPSPAAAAGSTPVESLAVSPSAAPGAAPTDALAGAPADDRAVCERLRGDRATREDARALVAAAAAELCGERGLAGAALARLEECPAPAAQGDGGDSGAAKKDSRRKAVRKTRKAGPPKPRRGTQKRRRPAGNPKVEPGAGP